MNSRIQSPARPVDPATVPQRKLSRGARMPAVGLGTFGSKLLTSTTAVHGVLSRYTQLPMPPVDFIRAGQVKCGHFPPRGQLAGERRGAAKFARVPDFRVTSTPEPNAEPIGAGWSRPVSGPA